MVSKLQDQGSTFQPREELMTPVPNKEPVTANQQWVTVNPTKQPIRVMLGDNNFLVWKQQVTAALRGVGLLGFINGTETYPLPPTIQGAENEKVMNPAYDYWQRQDSLIMSWLLSSIFEHYLTDLVRSDTSSEIWSTLLRSFVSQTRGRVSQYKQEIKNLKKNNHTMREYLSKMKSLSDALASVGHQLSDDDQISNITNGLGSEYESVVVSITSRVEPYTVSEASALLLAHEKRIEAYTLNPDGSSPIANLAFNTPQKKQHASGSQTHKSNQYQNHQNFYGSRGRGRGRSNGGRWSNNKPQCQLCGKFGHTIHKYSGASNHVTNSLSKLNVGAEYHGNSKLQVGNGAGFGQGPPSREI
ncbi:hypothetical protein LWI28_027488 [Acer negundo]|uniref:Retrotransposon Copia-like N-terminal domain-containing protein n=1 Tax=Acer negundo TaxID=4023 RepID=A0AAD5P6J7_ACENE|nr:hypothetical protein LWI28_027488 [Acer negundo]